MEITRQHETTTIKELAGTTTTKFLGVGPSCEVGLFFCYLETNGVWYRFSIQHGVLFWDTTAPDPEDDLAGDDEDEDYVDIFATYGFPIVEHFQAAEMCNATLTIKFASGRILSFKESEETGGMTIRVT